MCGINISIGRDQEHEIIRMNKKIAHRGLRSTTWRSGDFHLGHVRLPIQGLDTEHDQPYHKDNLTAAFVGEVFNFRDIYLDKDAKTDLPVLLKLFEEVGPFKIPNHADGFFSLVVFDIIQKKLYILMDELGKKPLYIKYGHKSIKISSEIKALVKQGEFIDETYFSSVAKWGYHIGNRTPYRNIKKIPPNTLVTIDLNNRMYERSAKKLEEIQPYSHNRLRPAIEKAVKNRLVSDVPVSVLLSGGLDSTIIYYLMKQYTNNFTVFHVDNDEAEYLNYIDFKGIRVRELKLDPTNKRIAYYFNETPVDIGSVIPQFALGRAIQKEGMHVALSGDGADELFGGYSRAATYDSQRSDIFEELVYYHLPRLDKLMMASTVELRSPFLSRAVISQALNVPYHQRINKRILKHLFSDIVPGPILERKKVPLRISEMDTNREQFKLDNIKFFRKEILNECE